MRVKPEGGAIHIEEIQDQVELALMRSGEHEVARAYVLYREKRTQERAAQAKTAKEADQEHDHPHVEDGVRKPLDLLRLREADQSSCEGLGAVDADLILKATLKDLYDGVSAKIVRKMRGAGCRARTSRKTRVQLRHRPPAADRSALKSSARGLAGRHGHQVRRILPGVRQARHQDWPAQPGAGQL